MSNPKLRYLEDVPWDNSLKLSNGKVVHGLEQLPTFIQFSDEEVFLSHVNDQKNDFAKWIKEMVGDAELANKILPIKTKEEFIKVMEQGILDIKKYSEPEPQVQPQVQPAIQPTQASVQPTFVPSPSSQPTSVQGTPPQSLPASMPTPLPTAQTVISPNPASQVSPVQTLTESAPQVAPTQSAPVPVAPPISQSPSQVSPTTPISPPVAPQPVAASSVPQPVAASSVPQPVPASSPPTAASQPSPVQSTPISQSIPVPSVTPTISQFVAETKPDIKPDPSSQTQSTVEIKKDESLFNQQAPNTTTDTASSASATSAGTEATSGSQTTNAGNSSADETYDFEEIFKLLLDELELETFTWENSQA